MKLDLVHMSLGTQKTPRMRSAESMRRTMTATRLLGEDRRKSLRDENSNVIDVIKLI